MNLLLDTHALLWLVLEPGRLSSGARHAVTAPGAAVLASHVSLWELASTRGRGRLDVLDRPARRWFEHYVGASGLRELPIRADHLGGVEQLPDLHRDPFDRLLVAQAMAEGLAIVTADPQVAAYEVPRIW